MPKSRFSLPCPLAATIVLCLVPAQASFAEDDRPPGWYDSAELSLIATGGNSESTTFGFRNRLERLWDAARFELDAGGLRAQATSKIRTATGSLEAPQIIEESRDQTTAENYFLRGRYERKLSGRLFAFAGLGWERNEFAGFDQRTSGVLGVGHNWWQGEGSSFDTAYGVTYTHQEDLVPNPNVKSSFVGLRLSADYRRVFGENSTFRSHLDLDPNLEEGDDWRAYWANSLTVSMTERLALKAGLELFYDNLPGLVAVPIQNPPGAPLGVAFASLDDLDTVFTAALVVDF